MQSTELTWECPQCLQQNSVRDIRCPRCYCLNPNASATTMRAVMATSTKSNIPIAVFWFVFAVIVLVIDGYFWSLSAKAFTKASADRVAAAQYASDCTPSAIATGSAGVEAVDGAIPGYDEYEMEHENDPCRFAMLPGVIHLQGNELTALRPPGYYLDTDSEKWDNVSVRLAPSPTGYPLMPYTGVVIEYWHDIATAVTCDGTRYLSYANPNVAMARHAKTGNTWRMVALGTLLVVFVSIALGVVYLRKKPY